MKGLVKSNTTSKVESKKPSPKKGVEAAKKVSKNLQSKESTPSPATPSAGLDKNSLSGRRVSTRSKKPGKQ